MLISGISISKLKKMNKKIILLASAFTLLMSCSQTKKEKIDELTLINKSAIAVSNQQKNEDYTLMKNNCYACHNPNTKSHDEIIAPPFVAVKRRYSMQYQSKEEFTNAVINWVQNPNEDKALMRGAVNEFKVMPKLPLDSDVLRNIANYMYENEMEEPAWFEEHSKQMHGRGKGKGRGMNRQKS